MNTEDVYFSIKGERLDRFMTEVEQIHYFGLCKPDHSDCSYGLCMYQGMRARGEFSELDKLLRERGKKI